MTVVAVSGSSAPTAPTGVKKTAKSKKAPSAHPPYGDMIKAALKELKERGGSSRQAIAKYIKANYQVDDRVESHLRRALVTGVKSGKLVHTKGIGASGSFKLADKTASPKKVAHPKPSKPKSSPKRQPLKSQRPRNQSPQLPILANLQPNQKHLNQRLPNLRRPKHPRSLK
ncbi:unnamed protein product [Heterobilharzia americana]|nr:unnamed protein product [Heterobilharzia americana]CAH8433792.1 unnamed protein product [Heterobilharzia americana]